MVPEALRITAEHMAHAKLTLNQSKTEMATRGHPHPQHTELYTNNFSIMGAAPPAVIAAAQHGDLPDAATGTPIEPQPQDHTLLQTQSLALTRITDLYQAAHIDAQIALALIRNLTNNIPVYRARTNLLPTTSTDTWDSNLYTAIGVIVGHDLSAAQRVQIHLPVALGGLGLQDLTLRSACAYLSAWSSYTQQATSKHICGDDHFRRTHPEATHDIQAAYNRIKHHLPDDYPEPTWTTWRNDPHS